MSMNARTSIGRIALAMLCFVPVLSAGATASASAVWGELEAGPYAPGFMAVEKYDYSRSFEAKRDYFGTPIPGERGRPVQICIWYPAVAEAAAPRMVYGEYAFVYPGDARLYGFLGRLQEREIGVLYYFFNNDLGAVIDLQSEEMAAVRDAPVADGRFPLILYGPHFNTNPTENLILCEYLASHGFVIASTHAYGPGALRSGEGGSDLEVLLADLGFVLASMHDFDFVDHDRIGVIGSGAGGIAALLFQMGNQYVDAVAGLNARFLDSRMRVLATDSPRYDVRSAAAPMFEICGGAQETFDPSLMDSLEFSERHLMTFPELGTLALNSYRMFLATAFGSNDSERRAYEGTCRYLLNFFEAYLNGSEGARAFLGGTPGDNGMDPAAVTFAYMQGREVPPTQEQFMAIMEERGVETAVGIFEKFRAEDAGLVLFQENMCNYAGYGFLQRGRIEDAIGVFRMNAAAYPNSANTWDSLGEAYVAAGDAEHAAECYRKVLEVLPADASVSEEIREVLRNNAEQYLQNLEGDESN